MWGVDDLDVPLRRPRARMGLGAVPRGCCAVMIGVVDVGPAAGPRRPRGARGPIVELA